jgi:hypothetical protein
MKGRCEFMPTVTVLTAVRNSARHLPQTIASIQAQSFQDWEWILVDDASTDGTPRIIEEYARRDKRMRLIQRAVSGGPYVAANEGLRQARGDYIVRTDGDDLSLPHRIQRQIQFLRSHPTCRACTTHNQYFTESGPLPGPFISTPESSGSLKWYLCLRCAPIHSSACIERRALEEIGGYVELPLAQDYRLWCELARRAWLAVVPEILVLVRVHSQRISKTRTAQQRAFAVEVLADHVPTLTRQAWTPEELDALFAVGHSELFPINVGLQTLSRWDSLWMADSSLTKYERHELDEFSALRRRKFVRSNARQQPVSFVRHMCSWLFPQPTRSGSTGNASKRGMNLT